MKLANKINCPNCNKPAKKVKGKKSQGWYFCTNPSCNRTCFEDK